MAHRLSSIRTSTMRKAVNTQISKPSIHENKSWNNHIRLACHPSSSSSSSSAALHSRQQQQQDRLQQAVLICNHTATTCGKCNLLGPTLQRQLLNNLLPTHLHYNSMGFSPTNTNWIVLRGLHTTSSCHKEKSIAEKTATAIKQKVEEAKKVDEVASSIELLNELGAKETVIFDKTVEEATKSPSPPVVKPEAAADAEVLVKKSIPQRIVAEVKHFYHGFRLLFMDVRLCTHYVRYVLSGRSLTRRERRQFVRTSADLFRLVPFSVFIIVPFMEFLLPVALKLFPNMLPSTFAEASKEQEKLRSRLKMKLEMAKFLQDTIEETALQKKGGKGESAVKFAAFLEKIRTSGTETNVEDILKYSKLFEDEITLDTLSHRQLMALCRLLEIPMPNLGTSNFLRFQLRQKLRQLKNDDVMIKKEGVDSLALWELQEACRARGMRSLGMPLKRLKSQLEQWLRLHLDESIPTSLLLLSRALYMHEELSTEEQLKQIIVELPTTAAEEAKVKISEESGERVDNKTKLDVITQEEAAIRAESMAEHKAKMDVAAVKKASDEAAAAAAAAAAKAMEAPVDVYSVTEPTIVDSAPEMTPAAKEVLLDKALEINAAMEDAVTEQATAAAAAAVAHEDEEISVEELEQVEDIIEQVAKERKITVETQSLKALKEDVEEYKEAVSELKSVVLASGEDHLQETKAAQRLSNHVDKMMLEMENAMDKLFKEKKALLEDMEVKEVRVKRSSELAEDEKAMDKVMSEISEKQAELISINDVMLSMRKIQKVPDDAKLQRILQVLDEDQDGSIDITDAIKVIELLGKDNMKLTSGQVSAIMNVIKHEDLIDKELKEKKKQEKQLQSEAAIQEENHTMLTVAGAAGERLKDTAMDLDNVDKPPLQQQSKRTTSGSQEASRKQ